MAQGSMSLLDYRRSVAGHYAGARSGSGGVEARWRRWRQQRDKLFREHPDSPLPIKDRKPGTRLPYYSYDPACRFEAEVEPLSQPVHLSVDLRQDGALELERMGRVRFKHQGSSFSLTLYWLQGYGGGVFLPFRDGTNGQETYGGGRYLLDSIKGADLGSRGNRLILDFNFAYNPSCAYDAAWHCPLAPPENWLTVPVRAGEMSYPGGLQQTVDASAFPR